MTKIFAFVLAALLSFGTLAWWDVGHEVVGEIAWSQLDEPTRTELTELFLHLSPIYPEAASLATLAKLPDNFRSGFRAFDAWHYISLPYSSMDTIKGPEPSETNVVWAICESIRTVRTEQPNPHFHPKAFEKAFMLAFLSHLVGDIHQPLHTITRFSPQMPQGDQGGNRFLIKLGSSHTNLHLYWDTGLGLFNDPFSKWNPTPAKSPRTDALAKSIMRAFPPQHFGKKIEEMVVRAWATESYELAKSAAYNLSEGAQPSRAYIARGQKIAKERVALAGYRLAFLLKRILAKESSTLTTGCSL